MSPRLTRPNAARLVAAAATATLWCSACASQPLPDPREAARHWAAAIEAGDEAAIYAMLSDSARRTFSPSINVIDGGLRWNVSDLAAKKEIILAGMGWGGLPAHLVQQELRRGTLVLSKAAVEALEERFK